jgi:S1-C subfamily serine protease
MTPAVTVELIAATVQLEQPLAGGMRTVGTGFLVSDPTPDGRPRVVLVTANHVFERMSGDEATIGYRVEKPDGSWTYAPQKITIRADGKALWMRHPSRDVAAISITAPPAFAQAAIPLSWLAGDDALARDQLAPGDEMMTLGYPQGLSANTAGFPILRAGRVASYPIGPSAAFPTFLLDFRVFPGNSGGPVYLNPTSTAADTSGQTPAPVIAGMLTQQVEVGQENLGIGIVTQAEFIRQTVAELDQPPPDAAESVSRTVTVASAAASALSRTASAPQKAVAAQAFANSP